MNIYEQYRNKSLALLEEIENDSNIKEVLNMDLPNSSEETDYDAWREGSLKFANDNFDLLKEWIN